MPRRGFGFEIWSVQQACSSYTGLGTLIVPFGLELGANSSRPTATYTS